jgi:hypothetical protein
MAFGWGTVAMSTPNGLPVTQAAYPQNSSCYATLSLFDTTGAPYSGASVLAYRIDDRTGGNDILSWTPIPVIATVNKVTITSPQNALVSNTRTWETHQITFQITDSGNVFYVASQFDIYSLFTPHTGMSPWPGSVDAGAPTP